MSTIIMTRVACCESYKRGERCSICPHRPENFDLVQSCQRQIDSLSLGRRLVSLPEQCQPEHGVRAQAASNVS